MNSSSNDIDKVSDIIKVLNGGIEFYRDGLKHIVSENVYAMFNRMIDEKERAINALQPFVVKEQGEAQTDSSFCITVRNKYTSLMQSLSSDPEHRYVSQLEEVEDKVLTAFDDALNEGQPSECATELRRIRSRMQQCHDEMKSLQEATSPSQKKNDGSASVF